METLDIKDATRRMMVLRAPSEARKLRLTGKEMDKLDEMPQDYKDSMVLLLKREVANENSTFENGLADVLRKWLAADSPWYRRPFSRDQFAALRKIDLKHRFREST